MNEQVSYWLREIVDYLHRTSGEREEVRKDAEYVNRIADDVEQYMLDIKQLFVDKCKSDPSCRKQNFENARRKQC